MEAKGPLAVPLKPGSSRGYIAVLLGAACAGVAALGVLAPWIFGIPGALLILTLSVVEYEPFFYFLVFILPLNMLVDAGPFIHDLGLGLRMIVVGGFFAGRWLRGELDVKMMWRPSITKASGLFFAAVAVSAALSSFGQQRAALRGVVFVATYIGFYLVMYVWLDSRQKIRKTVLTLMASTLAVCGFAFYQLAVGSLTSFWLNLYVNHAGPENQTFDPWQGRPSSVLGHPTHLAAYLVLMLAGALSFYLLSEDRTLRRLSGWVLALGFTTLLTAQTRGAYIAFAAVLLIAISYFVRSWSKRLVLVAALVALSVGVAFAAVTLFPARFAVKDQLSVFTRIILWSTAWQMFLTSPIHGIGFGVFPLISAQYLPPVGLGADLETHNIYIELLAETGILGFGAFCVLMGTFIYHGRRQLRQTDWMQRALAFTVVAGTVGGLVNGFSDHSQLWAVQVASLFWLWPALLMANTRLSSEELYRPTNLASGLAE